jgi:PAS domain S-box-containing protein
MANPALLKMLRYPSLEVLQNINFETEYPAGYSRQYFIENIEKHGYIKELESEWQRHDGTLIILSEDAWIVRDEAGNPQYYEGFLYDITDRKQADAERESLIRQLQSALSEVKRLSGLMPICASCKKVRDQDGNWCDIDDYINKHINTQFSHGICPDCAKKYFPSYFDDTYTEDA